jgi:hypothetical protein
VPCSSPRKRVPQPLADLAREEPELSDRAGTDHISKRDIGARRPSIRDPPPARDGRTPLVPQHSVPNE